VLKYHDILINLATLSEERGTAITTERPENESPNQPWLAYKRAMIVVAHPDDAEFGFGGALAKIAKEGMQLAYVLCTSGDKGSSDPDIIPAQLALIREQEQRDASAIIGTTDVTFLRYGDGELESSIEVIGKIVREVRRFKPDIIFCQDTYNRTRHTHRDHRMAGQSTFDAAYPYARDHLHFPEHMAEGLETHKVAEIYTGIAEDPDVVIDTSDVIDIKIQATLAHRSQISDPAGMEERIRGRVSVVAEKNGFKYAEGFRRHTFNPGRPQPITNR
jgi:LmbE family N-acetylglucosaminyl deacetylase